MPRKAAAAHQVRKDINVQDSRHLGELLSFSSAVPTGKEAVGRCYVVPRARRTLFGS